MKNREEGLTLFIELSPEEAAILYDRARTNDPALLPGIAKSFVLRSGDVVDPEGVKESIQTVQALVDDALGNLGAKKMPHQDAADLLLYTREQLREQIDQVRFWATYFQENIDHLYAKLNHPFEDQYAWAIISDEVEMMIELLKGSLKKKISSTSH